MIEESSISSIMVESVRKPKKPLKSQLRSKVINDFFKRELVDMKELVPQSLATFINMDGSNLHKDPNTTIDESSDGPVTQEEKKKSVFQMYVSVLKEKKKSEERIKKPSRTFVEERPLDKSDSEVTIH